MKQQSLSGSKGAYRHELSAGGGFLRLKDGRVYSRTHGTCIDNTPTLAVITRKADAIRVLLLKPLSYLLWLAAPID